MRERERIFQVIETCSEIIAQKIWLDLRSSMIITDHHLEDSWVLLVVILGFSGAPEPTALAQVGLGEP